MSHHSGPADAPVRDRLPASTKIYYLFGDIGISMCLAGFGFFILFFYADIAGVSPGLVGTVLLLAKIWDAVTDPADKVAIDGESILPVDRMRLFNVIYSDKEDDYVNPFLSPVCATPEMLANLPPALIITAGKDCLRHEAEKYAMMLVDAGVDVRMRKFLNSDHGFLVSGQAEHEKARELIVRALAETFRR